MVQTIAPAPSLPHVKPLSDPTSKIPPPPPPPPPGTAPNSSALPNASTYADAGMAAAAAATSSTIPPRPLFRYVPPLPNVEYDRMNIYDAWGYAGYVDIPRSDSFDRRHYVLWTMGLYQANLSEPVLRRCFWPNYQ